MSLRDALARKQRRTTTYEMVVEDPSDAEQAYDRAQAEHRMTVLRHGEDSDEARAAQVRLDEAADAVRACVVPLRFGSLAAHRFEELVAEHPPTEEQAKDGAQWGETFEVALIAACALDSDLTVEEWQAELASDYWSRANRSALFATALAANVTPRSVSLPFGSGRTRS